MVPFCSVAPRDTSAGSSLRLVSAARWMMLRALNTIWQMRFRSRLHERAGGNVVSHRGRGPVQRDRSLQVHDARRVGGKGGERRPPPG